jgi:hypothetical protein
MVATRRQTQGAGRATAGPARQTRRSSSIRRSYSARMKALRPMYCIHCKTVTGTENITKKALAHVCLLKGTCVVCGGKKAQFCKLDDRCNSTNKSTCGSFGPAQRRSIRYSVNKVSARKYKKRGVKTASGKSVYSTKKSYYRRRQRHRGQSTVVKRKTSSGRSMRNSKGESLYKIKKGKFIRRVRTSSQRLKVVHHRRTKTKSGRYVSYRRIPTKSGRTRLIKVIHTESGRILKKRRTIPKKKRSTKSKSKRTTKRKAKKAAKTA